MKEIILELDFFITAVNQNNRENYGSWSNWENGYEIIDTYMPEIDNDLGLTYIIEDYDYIANELNLKVIESINKGD